MTTWTACKEYNGTHILPYETIEDHDIEECWCQPVINTQFNTITHRAFEDRVNTSPAWEIQNFHNPWGFDDNVKED